MKSRWAIFAIALLGAATEPPKHLRQKQLLGESRLEALHRTRLEWSRKRVVYPPLGLYTDFRASFYPGEATEAALRAAREAGVRILLWTGQGGEAAAAWHGYHQGVLVVPGPEKGLDLGGETTGAKASQGLLPSGKKLASLSNRYPDEVYALAGKSTFPESSVTAFRSVSTHVLAQQLTDEEIRESLHAGHAYLAHDWLCDPTGFSFVAANNLGVFDMGDPVPRLPNTKLIARFPTSAHIKLIHNAAVVYQTIGEDLTFAPREDGPYRLEATLSAGGEDHPWIYSNTLDLRSLDNSELALPRAALDPADVKVIRDIPYTAGKPEDENSHKLDLYLPAGKTGVPVLFFVHGATFKTGGRGLYAYLGLKFAKLGIAVAIPSYRLPPANPHTAQIEDVAAAFSWTSRHISDYGGDAKRIFVAGHSLGGNLVALLALDPRYLAAYKLTPESIRGVMSLSGIYDVRQDPAFGPDEQSRRAASPLEYVSRHTPPFLIAYCQWDYLGFPAQARRFDGALRHNFNVSKCVFIPRENHISEIVRLWRDDDPTARAMLKFMDEAMR